MAYTHEREAFIHRLATYGVPLSDCRAILRAAGRLQRIAEIECSVDTRHLPGLQTYCAGAERAEQTIRDIVGPFPLSPAFHGDPRGYVTELNAADGTTFGIPAQGWTAKDLERFDRMADRVRESA